MSRSDENTLKWWDVESRQLGYDSGDFLCFDCGRGTVRRKGEAAFIEASMRV